MESKESDRFLSRREAAALLGLSEGTLAVWQCRKRPDRPPARKHGGRVVYSERELRAWSEGKRV
jgi:predicted DNA-binding transcriptional regulator AlpA